MLIYFNVRILCVINMWALLVNDCCGTVVCMLLLLEGYNMLVLLVEFVRQLVWVICLHGLMNLMDLS